MNPDERIRQGVETLRRNGAPEEVIQAYVQRETAAMAQAQPPAAPATGGGGRSGGPGMGGPAVASRVANAAGLTAGETLRGAGRAALQGLTAQFGDELEAGVRTGSLSGPRYQAVRDSLRGEQARFAAEYPKGNLAAEMVGGIAPVVGATLATGGAAATTTSASTSTGATAAPRFVTTRTRSPSASPRRCASPGDTRSEPCRSCLRHDGSR